MQRKKGNTRLANSDEKKFQGWLKEQVCCVTGEYGVQVHHCVGSSFKHNKELIGHLFCIPLSVEAHRDYHSRTKSWREENGPQWAKWSIQMQRYQAETGYEVPDMTALAILDLGK